MGRFRCTRKRNEGVWIGKAHVRVVKTGSSRAILEIVAPDDIRIDRDELRSEVAKMATKEVKREG
jgi:sRNA-binding carbon storage regulator CsrA